MEEDTPNFRQTSSRVVSRWKLSITTLNLNSGSYCFRLAAMSLVPFWFASFAVYFTRCGTYANGGGNLITGFLGLIGAACVAFVALSSFIVKQRPSSTRWRLTTALDAEERFAL